MHAVTPLLASLRSGLALPQTGSPVQASAEIVIVAPAERVWQILTAIEHWPQWYSAVDRARLSGPLAAGSTFRWKSQGFEVRSTLCAVQAQEALAWQGRAFGTRACHAWRLLPDPQGVRVRTAETFDGWLPRLMTRTL